MKKFVCMLVIFALLCGAALAEGKTAEPMDTEMEPETAYEGTWISDRATLVIESLDDIIYCTIHWGGGHKDAAEWSYEDLIYDEISGGLTTFETGVKTIVEYGEDGEIVSSEVEYSDGAASFVINGDGMLVWTDFKETPGENEMTFERAPEATAPSAGELTDFYFRVICAVEQGTAGASLKMAKAAVDVTTFAAYNELWDPDIEALRANMLEGWESLTAEEQSAFDANFLEIVALIDASMDDWESNRGIFEDADVSEQMEMIVYDPLNRLAWENLYTNTLTMGNSDDE